MAWLAYVLLPFTGLPAYLMGRDARMRFHGLQAIFYGFMWPAVLFGTSYLSTSVTQIVFGLGGVLWLVLLFGTMFGRDPKLPFVADFLTKASEESVT